MAGPFRDPQTRTARKRETEFGGCVDRRRVRREERGREAWEQSGQRRKRGKVASKNKSKGAGKEQLGKGAAQEGAYKRARNGMLGRRWGKPHSEGTSGMLGEVRDSSRRVRRWEAAAGAGAGRGERAPRWAAGEATESQCTRKGSGGPREGLAVGREGALPVARGCERR